MPFFKSHFLVCSNHIVLRYSLRPDAHSRYPWYVYFTHWFWCPIIRPKMKSFRNEILEFGTILRPLSTFLDSVYTFAGKWTKRYVERVRLDHVGWSEKSRCIRPRQIRSGPWGQTFFSWRFFMPLCIYRLFRHHPYKKCHENTTVISHRAFSWSKSWAFAFYLEESPVDLWFDPILREKRMLLWRI